MEDMMYLNDNYEFIIKTKRNHEYNASVLFDKVKSYPQPDDIKTVEMNGNEMTFEFEDTIITFYMFSTKCFLEDKNINTVIYSQKNLELILEKLDYENPILYLENKKKRIPLKDINLNDLKIFLRPEIVIKKDIFTDLMTKIKFNEQVLCMEEFRKRQFSFIFKNKLINFNYNRYYELSEPDEEEDDSFFYINTKPRLVLENDVNEFIRNQKMNILQFIGPYGIGKSITTFIIQKNLFLKGFKSLYINLRYYNSNFSSWEEKLETLINECFYLCTNFNEFLFYKNLLTEKYFINIFQYIERIYSTIPEPNNYLFIFDHYEKQFELEEYLFKFTKVRIFLISTMNDEDIKHNIQTIFERKIPRLKYIYKKQLIERGNNILIKIYKDKLIKKIPDENPNVNTNNENYIMNKLILINNVLKLFGYLPEYISLLINKYDNIFDFLNQEYKKIFIYYKRFFDFNNITKFQNTTMNYLNKGEQLYFMDSNSFLDNLYDIPLEYINYEEISYNYYLEFSFPLSEEIYKIIYKYNSCKIKFLNQDLDYHNEILKYFLKLNLMCCDKLKIDGYFEVENFSNFHPVNYYQDLNFKYFLNKSNVLITQINVKRKDFDFCIYKPKENALILIRVEYCIRNGRVTAFKNYKEKYQFFKAKFEKEFKRTVDAVYILYFSSYYYNEDRKKDVLNVLKTKEINCVFFNVPNNEVSLDFEEYLNEITLTDSFIVYPKDHTYVPQWEHIAEEPKNFLQKKKFMKNKIQHEGEPKIKKIEEKEI